MDAREYFSAYTAMQRLLKSCPHSRQFRSEYVKLLIARGLHGEVQSELMAMQSHFPIADIYYLKALLLKSEGNQ